MQEQLSEVSLITLHSMNRLLRDLGINCIIKVLKLVNAKIISASNGAITPLILALYTGQNLHSIFHCASGLEAYNTNVEEILQ